MNGTMTLATMLPSLRWRGWRPPFLNHRSDERGGHLVLVLEREGELLMLPCALVSYCFAFPAWENWQEADALCDVWGDGADAQMMQRALDELEADGWRVIGRLVIEFVGTLAEDGFWQQVQAVLRQERKTR